MELPFLFFDAKINMCNVLKNKYIPFVLAIPLFFCVHCYRGIILDAILYLLQYISTFDPLRFLNDPAFAFGNQGSYGVFSPILGFFIESLGVGTGMKTLCWLSHLGWAISAVLLVKAFCKYSLNKLYLIPILVLFIFCTADGMPHTRVFFFKLVENYTCSRAFSIVFGFIGIAALLQNKRKSSLLSFLIGTLIHPLTAGWGLPLWLMFFYPKMRVPLIVFSALFPLLAFLHIGKFDFYPLDWLKRPLEFSLPTDMVVRNIVWFIFYGVLVPRYFLCSPLAKLGKAIFIVTLIAFYWNVWGGVGEHIFLYQVQTWRAEWIPSVFSFLFCFVMIVQLLKSLRKKHFDGLFYSKFLAVVALMSTVCQFVPIAVAVALAYKKSDCIDKAKFLYACLAYFVIAGFMVQQYVIWCLEGQFAFLGFDYHYLYRLQNSLLLNQAIFALLCMVVLVRRKKYFFTIPLALLFLFPQYQLLPLCVVSWFLVKSRKKFVIALVIVLTLFDCLFNTNYREHSLFNSLPSSLYKYGGFALLSFFMLKLTSRIWNNVCFRFVPIVLLFAVLGGYAYAHWDGRRDLRIKEEAKLQSYLKETIFPQEKDRGRILFYVKGFLEIEPRLQFLSGAYLCETTHVGELFFEGQYKEAKKRENLLFYKEDRGVSHDGPAYIGFVTNKMSSRDTLIDRVQFLCEMNEIDNLISSEEGLPFAKKDSVFYDERQWVYLYGCL